MKRTTLALDEDLLRRIKEKAASQDKTVGALVNDLLKAALSGSPRARKYKLDLKGWEANLQPGVNLLDRDSLFDLMNGR